MTKQELFQQIKAKKSFLCIGLDTDFNKIPEHLKNHDCPVFEFNKAIIDSTHQMTVAYKLNAAFYECRGSEGLNDLAWTVEYLHSIHPEIMVIVDAKRGDIGNTSTMYAKYAFEYLDADALTIAPYMGEDSVTPFLAYPGKWSILLALTSNEGSFDFQLLEDCEGMKFYEHVLTTSQRWPNASSENMMYVVGATRADELENIRQIVPNHFLLVPGVGKQGGSLEEVARYGLNGNCGLLVNSSRGIIFASKGEDFAEAAQAAAHAVQTEMETYLREARLID